ncbi:hypothetical protein V5F32_20480 [Xanthobacter oligotrophicus]|uniref:Uncharacterized protein n=1 Tax=Xanthobacter oligotrophicus TaxID=2607286 RepID=A0ABW7A0L6_9HYPH
MDALYNGPSECGIIWNDPDLAIHRGFDGETILCDKDLILLRLKDFQRPFVHTGG